MYGLHRPVVQGFNAYAEKFDDAADAGSRTGSEIVQELYGDLSANFTYYHPNEKLNLERACLAMVWLTTHSTISRGKHPCCGKDG